MTYLGQRQVKITVETFGNGWSLVASWPDGRDDERVVTTSERYVCEWLASVLHISEMKSGWDTPVLQKTPVAPPPASQEPVKEPPA